MADAPVYPTVYWPNYSARNSGNISQTGEKSLGKDEFLKLLVTQLRHQDPMQPLQDREFIAQMAQFSALEQMMNMAEEMRALRQSLGITPDYIGKWITWRELNESGTEWMEYSGVVDAVSFSDGIQYAIVGKKKVALDQIIMIRNEKEAGEPEEEQEEVPPAQEESPPGDDTEN